MAAEATKMNMIEYAMATIVLGMTLWGVGLVVADIGLGHTKYWLISIKAMQVLLVPLFALWMADILLKHGIL